MSEEAHRLMLDSLPDAAVLVDLEGKLLAANSHAAALTGCKRAEELVGRSFFQFLAPEEHSRALDQLQRILETGSFRHSRYQIRRVDGSTLIGELGSSLIRDSNGRPNSIVAVIRDATEHHRLEQAAQAEGALRQAIEESILCGIVVADSKGRLTHVNSSFCRMTGFSKEELLGSTAPFKFWPPEKADAYAAEFDSIFRGEKPSQFREASLLRRDGGRFDAIVLASGLEDEQGNTTGWVASVEDFTAHKKMEEALQASEARFRTLAEQIPNATTYVSSLHEISTTTYVSPQIEQLTGFTPEDFRADPDLWAKRIHPDDFKEVMRKVAQSHSSSERLETEYRVIRKDGRVIWFRDIADLVRDGNGKPICLIGLNIDITERKRAEEASREAEDRFHQMAENVREVFWISDPWMAQIFYASSAYEEIWGRPVEDVLHHPESLFEAILPEDRHLMTNSLEQQEKGKDTDIEFRIRRPDGSIRWIRNRAYPIRNEKGEVYRVTGFGEDVTERKKSVEALKIFQQALQSTGDAVGIADPLGRHVYQNQALYDLFGYSLDELNAAGGPLAIFVDKKEGSRVMETIMAAGSVAHEVEVVDKQGRRFLVFQRADSIKDADGRIVGLIGIHRDITDYKRVEAELQEYSNRLRGMAVQLGKAEEIGRQRIARELHDGVGQNLTALGISLNILRSRLPTESQAELAPLWKDSLDLVQETVQHIRDVMAELRPPLLDDYGLVAALGWYVRRFSQRTGIIATIEGKDPKPRLPLKVELSLFRIAQEAMTNVAKHGHATRIDVVMEVRDGAICLIIADDGVGFDPRSIPGSGEQGGWGLLIMKERAEAANGQFLLESKPGQGTRVIVEMPTT